MQAKQTQRENLCEAEKERKEQMCGEKTKAYENIILKSIQKKNS